VNAEGSFVFEGEETLAGGMYLIVLPPDNRFFQILVDEKDQHFSMYSDNPTAPSDDLKITGSPENKRFYDYLDFLQDKRPIADKLRAQIEAATEAGTATDKLDKKMEALNEEVTAYQQKILSEYPTSLTAAVIRANMPLPDMPEFNGTEDEVRFEQWQWTKAHYFDNINLADPRMLRTPFLFQRVDQYIENLTTNHPDSINVSLERVLEAMRPASENFRYYLAHYLTEYAQSKVVGYDAMYVFLVEKYYKTGAADWVDEEQLEKILDNAKRIKPLLIGKIAPNIKMQTQDGKELWLHDFESPYTVLFFWDPECGHCKKSMPDMISFYNQFKDRGVEIFAVCTKFYDELDSCWGFIEEKQMGIWLNTVDPYHKSRYKSVYDIRSTPQIYILDSKKEILSKRIGAEQLPEVMEKILEMNAG